ncbi:MAG: hypothetical protein QM734_03200 [Cyclobacteriaceae bacterium]
MEEFNLIEFHRTRDFGKKINTTFEFIKQNFKPLLKSILLIAGPAVLIGSIMLGAFFSDFLAISFKGNQSAETLKYFTSFSFWGQMGLMYVFLFLSYVISLATINSYIVLYYKKKTNQIEVSEVWDNVRSLLWKYLGSLLLIVLSACLIVFIGVILGIVFQQISGVLLAILIVGFVIGFIYLTVGISFVFFIQAFEGASFFDAAARSLKLVRGKWWSTFGLSFILSLIGGAISYIFIIPYYIFMLTSMMHNVQSGGAIEMSPTLKTVSYVFFTLYYMSQMLCYSLPHVGISFQYFNLVELKESKGLLSDIENFGKPVEPDQPTETF